MKMTKNKTFTIGADPEIFVGFGGKFISAHGLVKGDKKNPFPVQKGAVQVDGMALEFNIDPASDFDTFESNLSLVQEQLKSMIGDREFLRDTSVSFTEDFLKGIPIENVELGCEPDFNAYTGGENVRPSSGELMRTVGGHVHVGGFETDDPMNNRQMIMSGHLARILDDKLGVYSILWDKDDKRRSMYGKAGSFRPKKYGMEYRTLSNAWIFSKDLVKFVYDAVEESFSLFEERGYQTSEFTQEIIDTSNRSHSFFKNNEKADQIRDLVGA